MNKICFICGLKEDDFNRNGKDFRKHIGKEHDPWNYIYYLYFLECTTDIDYRRIDNECYHQFKARNINWLPNNETIFLGIFFGDKNLDKKNEYGEYGVVEKEDIHKDKIGFFCF